MEPVILALENKYQGKVEFIIANVDDPEGSKLAQSFNVNTIPAFFFIDPKKNIQQKVEGSIPLNQMEQAMDSMLE